ncbi:hypothetical protein SRHO_G00111110 [Serrasalmus rhombeus]
MGRRRFHCGMDSRFISSYETVKNLLHDGRHDIIQRANPPVSQKHEESGESAVAAQRPHCLRATPPPAVAQRHSALIRTDRLRKVSTAATR